MAVRYILKRILNNNLIHLSLKFILIIAWCDHVIVSPEEIKIIVFNKGISYELKRIPLGGPISISGDKDIWKNAKKKI